MRLDIMAPFDNMCSLHAVHPLHAAGLPTGSGPDCQNCATVAVAPLFNIFMI